MAEQELAALQAAADEAVISDDTEASEATENTEGQVESQPANAEAEAAEKTKSQLRRERRENAERRRQEEAEAAKKRLADTEAELARIRQSTLAEPKEADFTDPIEFAAARGAWRLHSQGNQAQETRLTEQIEAIQKAEERAEIARISALADDFKKAIPDMKARYPDFDQAYAVAVDPAIVSPALSIAILESEAAHDIAYHLGKNPEVALRLSNMNPVQAARELGKLEARLSEPKPVTTAPDPYRPNRGAATPTPGDPRSMSISEWAQRRKSGWTPDGR